ncbi:hypothetical protein GQ54DRAFT_304777 [Martensiomyces pterosporus]|nr:hypothetical protein GQ54DRAFT_304777 [Martensiomyces pterosporus]
MSLPFGVRSVFPLHIGLLVQRKTTDPSDKNLFAARLPTIFSLLSPRSEFKMLGLSPSDDLEMIHRHKSRQLVLSPAPSTGEGAIGSIPIFNDPDSVLVGVATSRHDKSSQFALCWESNMQRYAVYRCIVAHQSLETAADTCADADSSTADAVDAEKGLQSASRKTTDRHASLSVRRRSSAAAAAAAMAAASRRKSGVGSAVKSDRRGSLLGRVSFNDSPGPNYAVDVFREQRQMKAEVILYSCWKERRHRQDKKKEYSWQRAQICVAQSTAGKDIICILQGTTCQVVGLDAASFNECFRFPALSIAAASSIRRDLDNLVMVAPSGHLSIVCGSGGDPIVCTTPPHLGEIAQIVGVEGAVATVSVKNKPGQTAAVNTQVRMSRLVLATIDALSFVLSRSVYPMFLRHIVASLQDVDNAEQEIQRLSSLILCNSGEASPEALLPQRVKAELCSRASAVLFALQLVYEDASMYKAEPRSRMVAMGQLLLQFAWQNGLHSAYQFYLREGFRPRSSDSMAFTQARTFTGQGTAVTPSFSRWAQSVFNNPSSKPPPFPALGDIAGLFHIDDAEPAFSAGDSLGLLAVVADVVWRLACKNDASTVLQSISSSEPATSLLSQLSPGTQWLIRTVLMELRGQCTPSWPTSILKLLNRHDVAVNSGTSEAPPPPTPPPSRHFVGRHRASAERKGLAELCEEMMEQDEAARNTSDGIELAVKSQEISEMTFSRDLRVDEALRLLQSTMPVFVPVSLAGIGSPEEAEGVKSQHMQHLACRTLSLPTGRAFLTYSTQDLNPQDALAIPDLSVSARFRGHKLATPWGQGDTDVSWPLFHNGVAAALSLDRGQAKGAHPSWVLLNWPSATPSNVGLAGEEASLRKHAESLASHAGFLFGMGLLPEDDSYASNSTGNSGEKRRSHSGPLCDIPPWQSFKYLSTRHGLTSIALLLGCACAHKGTMNASASKILALHIPNLLPTGSSELMLLSYGTQAAAMLGLGLLYMGSQNRRMVEVMLRELSAYKCGTPASTANRLDGADPAESTAECYSLASGFALGLVVLGQGLSTRALADLHLLDALSELVGGSSISISGSSGSNGYPQPSKAMDPGLLSNDCIGRPGHSPSARAAGDGGSGLALGPTAAIGLIFLGTNYKPAAQRLQLPQTTPLLQSVDPFVLLWKTLMRCVIMLDSVQPSLDWVESNVPHMQSSSSSSSPWLRDDTQTPPDLHRARLHIVSAACFAIALKYAGTEDRLAQQTILAYFDELETVLSTPSLGYEASLTRAAAQACLDIVCVSAGLIMAGSGDVATMKRLRRQHATSAGKSYGSHLASHMALGMLFIGGGARFTLSQSRESIALLLISFFPRFPQHFSDNREHLQAWRHLWAMCVKPRCLVVRDVVSGSMCKDARISIVSREPSGNLATTRLVPPAFFPSLANAVSIRLQAPGYIPLELDLLASPHTGPLISKRRAVYMQPCNGTANAMANPHAALITPERYQRWLSSMVDLVRGLCAKLPATNSVPDAEAVFSATHAIKQLRVCVQFSRGGFMARSKGTPSPLGLSRDQSFHWAEATHLAWVSVREEALSLARQDACRRLLTAYWTRSQPSGDPCDANGLGVILALLDAVLDLPTPADAMELAKKIPITHLIDFVLE